MTFGAGDVITEYKVIPALSSLEAPATPGDHAFNCSTPQLHILTPSPFIQFCRRSSLRASIRGTCFVHEFTPFLGDSLVPFGLISSSSSSHHHRFCTLPLFQSQLQCSHDVYARLSSPHSSLSKPLPDKSTHVVPPFSASASRRSHQFLTGHGPSPSHMAPPPPPPRSLDPNPGP